MTTRTETAPVAGQHRRTATHPTLAALLDAWFPPRCWRGVGTAVRMAAALVLLYCATQTR